MKDVAKIEIYLATNQAVVRERVYSVLKECPNIEIIEESADNQNVFSAMKSQAPLAVILDIRQSPDSWADMTRQIREGSPSTAVILLTDSHNDGEIYKALRCGANACLSYDSVPGKLINTIREVVYGGLPIITTLLRPYVASRTLQEFHNFSLKRSEINWPDNYLTFQQRTLLQYIVNRHTVPQLILYLGISQNGIREQLERIRAKLVDLDKCLRPVFPPAPNPMIEAETGLNEVDKKRASKIAKKAGSPAKQVSTDRTLPIKTTLPRRLFKSIFRLSFSRVIMLFIVIIIGFFLSIHLLPGYNMYVVSSESMKPTINIGDVIVTRELNTQSIGKLKSGDIITFEHEKGTVTHRLLSITGDKAITKGDAAEESDPWSINLSDIKDVYLFRIPYLGYVPDFAKEKLGWFLLIILPAVLLVALLVRDIIREALRSEKPAKVKQGGGVISNIKAAKTRRTVS